MLLILLYHFLRVNVELKYFSIAATSQENVLFFILRMKSYTLRCSLIIKTPYNFSGFCIPKLYYLIKASWKEFAAIILKANVFDCFLVAHVGSYASFMSQYVPNLTSTIMTCTEHQMPSFWKKFNPLNTFVMTTPRMKPFLWYKTIVFFLSQIAWSFNKTFTCRIEYRIAVVYRGCFVNLILIFIFVSCLLKPLFSFFFESLNNVFLFLA